MHKIFDLREMDIERLHALAEELGVKGHKRMDKDTLVYAVLDEEAKKNAQNLPDKPERARRGRPRKEAKENSFGLVALCSIGPILTVLILGLLMPSNLTYTYDIAPEVTSFTLLLKNYIHEILPIIKDVFISLFPILAVFVIFNLITKKVKAKKVTHLQCCKWVTAVILSRQLSI